MSSRTWRARSRGRRHSDSVRSRWKWCDCLTAPSRVVSTDEHGLSRSSHHPGGSRGPIGEVAVTKCCAQLATSPNWAPAFAGVVLPRKFRNPRGVSPAPSY
ncbi:hypothetical protein [Sphingomonas faeni]|uniref:hypothetical protein n=1 Tax=Sphingomonas TaxID=13687 RepID=UPI003D7FEC69